MIIFVVTSALKIEAVCFSEMSIPTYQTIRCHNTQGQSMNLSATKPQQLIFLK
jgi:hypothetical protein